MYSNTLILDYIHYISAKTDIFEKGNHFQNISSHLTLLVTFDLQLVCRVGTVREGSWKMRKGINPIMNKYISEYLLWIRNVLEI